MGMGMGNNEHPSLAQLLLARTMVVAWMRC